MKILKLSATLALLGSLTLGMAETAVDARIAAINSATGTERVQLVNEFKELLSTLSTEDRAEAIDQLKTTVQADGEQLKTRTRTRATIRERVNQADQTDEMLRTQQMQQNRSMQQMKVNTNIQNSKK